MDMFHFNTHFFTNYSIWFCSIMCSLKKVNYPRLCIEVVNIAVGCEFLCVRHSSFVVCTLSSIFFFTFYVHKSSPSVTGITALHVETTST